MNDIAEGKQQENSTPETDRVIVLDGQQLTIRELERIAVDDYRVELAEPALKRVEEAHLLIHELAAGGMPIYGLNRGVGLNKDCEITPEMYETFNRNLIYSHSAAVGPFASVAQVRAIMTARLNSLLVGCTGMQPAIVLMYRDMLNAGIHPLVPLRGSVGAADISVLSHIGQAILGEGDVIYKDATVAAVDAFQAEGLVPMSRLGPKDALAIVSSNALSSGTAALVAASALRLLDTADAIFALSLEALQGCTSPFEEGLFRVRPFEGAAISAANVRRQLRGGALEAMDRADRIQDPLSFRSACHVHGAARDALAFATKQLLIQLNGSDDNPCVLIDERRVVPSSNFDVTSWTIAFESFAIALSHVSKISCYRSLKLGTPSFTGLGRFLAPSPGTIAFGTLQKTYTSLDAEIRLLSNPVSADYFAIAGDIEDHANNTPLVIRKTSEIIDHLYYILGIEAMHAAQAIDLRGSQADLSSASSALYEKIRSVVPALTVDRPLTPDISAVYTLVRQGLNTEGEEHNESYL
ncbi:HAL/PAL/TAL family ammonia-lyase [Paenibacillus radicis (ex Gao et al. 2016)]|uniref:Exported histidine ammonia-lyase n=1 Tax=Paenibacillus radicis (ex Gao et al. 2016) TaxID=1737354 RepID=A0A917H4E5_9BACL|nr:aromatic amino acid ammonia-lyase [Paenibacillus radicis (ex Gao et al. 2016)]GGG67130.1 exported histidine ammonia-lyase [Paenibacillus radicis (ex Gao et al. 2016)]